MDWRIAAFRGNKLYGEFVGRLLAIDEISLAKNRKGVFSTEKWMLTLNNVLPMLGRSEILSTATPLLS